MFKMFKKQTPFSELYDSVSPKDFVSLFGGEIPQTMAFILSFCRRKRFVKKVVELLDEKEEGLNPLEKSSFTIREYLSKCGEDVFDKNFVREIEARIYEMVAVYKDFSDFRKTRKKLIFKHPKAVTEELAIQAENNRRKKEEFEKLRAAILSAKPTQAADGSRECQVTTA